MEYSSSRKIHRLDFVTDLFLKCRHTLAAVIKAITIIVLAVVIIGFTVIVLAFIVIAVNSINILVY